MAWLTMVWISITSSNVNDTQIAAKRVEEAVAIFTNHNVDREYDVERDVSELGPAHVFDLRPICFRLGVGLKLEWHTRQY